MKQDSNYLNHILEAVNTIESYTKNLSREDFLADRKCRDAVIRNVEIIGEAVKAVSSELRDAHPEIPWQQIARTRDKLIHHYFDVDDEELWEIVSVDLPRLKPLVGDILKNS